MRHLKMTSKMPVRAATIPVDDKIDFIVAILTAFQPILEAKQPTAG